MNELKLHPYNKTWYRETDDIRNPKKDEVWISLSGRVCTASNDYRENEGPYTILEPLESVANWRGDGLFKHWLNMSTEEREDVEASTHIYSLTNEGWVEFPHGQPRRAHWLYVGITPVKPKVVELIDDPTWENPADTPETKAIRSIASALGVCNTPFHILRRIEELKTWDPPYDGDTL